jgi:hypothetical protein
MVEIDFEKANKEPKTKDKAIRGIGEMENTASTDNASLKISGGGSGDGDKDFEEVLQKSQKDLTKVRQIINQGGFTGPEKDKYTISLHHAEWIHSRNLYMKCDNNIKETSVKYTALVNGKAQNNEILRAHKEWKDTREKCKKSMDDLYEKANQYIETDRRVRANKQVNGDIFPVLGSGVEGFANSISLKEGFDFHNNPDQIKEKSGHLNARLPRLKEDNNKNNKDNTTLPWNDYYTDCANQTDGKFTCLNANENKNKYITTVNALFDKSDTLINTLYKLPNSSGDQANAEIEKLLLNNSDIKVILENQKKNIALHKQNALYDYDEYNSLAFYEDLVSFLYYALFIILVVMSLRDYFTAGAVYDKRNIIILVVLGIYPKYILQVVLWILRSLTKIMEMLGLKNVRFWIDEE